MSTVRVATLSTFALVALVMGACFWGGDDKPTPTPTSESTAPPASPTPIPGHPLAEKTGNPLVDRILGAIAERDVDGLVDLTEFVMTPCSTENKLGGPPSCPEGVPPGTQVKSFPMGQGCEGSYLDEGGVRRAFESFVDPLNRTYAVYHDVASPGNPTTFEFPRGEFVIVQAFPVERPELVGSRLIAITNGRIVTAAGWCLQTLAERVTGLAPADFLMPPP